MITVRKSAERGFFDLGWLKTYHTFSFGDYYDPQFMGFRALRVINEDTVAPNKGFPTHPHTNMEIITIVLEGALAHGDSMGHEKIIKAGEVQVMSAGSGVFHSEYNPSRERLAHFLQIWIVPDQENIPPRYQQKSIQPLLKEGQWLLIASKEGKENSFLLQQNAEVFLAKLPKDTYLTKSMKKERFGYLQVAKGSLILNDISLNQGDGAFIQNIPRVEITANEDSLVVFFDLA